ncbi:7123_t:CDS:2, partial [Racocetra persica]
MAKVDNFRLNVNLCKPHTGISTFFSKTILLWWNNIEVFTKFAYEKDPTVTAKQVFDQYFRSLFEIATIKNIDVNVAQYVNNLRKNIVKTEYLKVIDGILMKKTTEYAKTRKRKMTQIQNNFKFTAEEDKENHRTAVYNDDEINNFFQSPPESQSQLFEKVVSDEDESFESDYEADEDEGECDKSPPKIDKSAFCEAHNTIPDNTKMRLKSGRMVEDVLFNYVKDKEYEDEIEWEELIFDRLSVPSLPQEIASELARYRAKSLEELRLNRAGLITIFRKDPQVYYLDSKFLAEGIKTFLKFLATVYRCKQIIKNNLDILNQKENNDIESNDDELYNELMGVSRSSTSSPSLHLVKYFADCWRTPKTKKKSKSKKWKLR